MRIEAQEQIKQFQFVSQWESLLRELPLTNSTILALITPKLCYFITNAPTKSLSLILPHIFFENSPFFSHPTSMRDILEVFLSRHSITYRSKVASLMHLVASHEKKNHLPDSLLILVARAFKQLRARRAITHFGSFMTHPNPEVVGEGIQALRSIRDPKSAIFLERLFESDSTVIASSAILAYGELGPSLWRSWRLYRLYATATMPVRRAIVAAMLQLPAWLSINLLVMLYRRETELELRFHIIKKVGLKPVPRVAKFLMIEAHESKEGKLRSLSHWILAGLPARAIFPALRWGLRHKNESIVRWCILKAGELPSRQALRTLAPFQARFSSLNPMLMQAVTESIAQASQSEQTTAWLINRVEGNPLCSITAISALLRYPKPPLTEILEKSSNMGSQAVEYLLSLLADHPNIPINKRNLDVIGDFLKRPQAQIRTLCARFLLRRNSLELTHEVWVHALDLSDDLDEIARLSGEALSSSLLSPSSIPFSLATHPRFNHLLGLVLQNLNHSAWDTQDWSELLTSLQCIPGNCQNTHDLVDQYLEDTPRFWKDIINRLLAQTRSGHQASRLAKLLKGKEGIVTQPTFEALLQALIDNRFENPEPIIEILADGAPSELLDRFTNWLLSLPLEQQMQGGLKALASWLKQLDKPLPNINQERAVG